MRETLDLIFLMLAKNTGIARYGMKSADQRGMYSGACTAYGSFCQYWDWCALGRPEDMLEQLYTVGSFSLAEQGQILGPKGEVVTFDGGL